jgi:hypothetical protein
LLSSTTDQSQRCTEYNKNFADGTVLLFFKIEPWDKIENAFERGIAFLLFVGEAAGCPFNTTTTIGLQPTAAAFFSFRPFSNNNNNRAHHSK